MNLKAIRQQIEDETQFAPAAERHRNALNDKINRALELFVESEPWVFRERTYCFAAFPDLSWGYTNWTISEAGVPARSIRVSGLSTPTYATVVNRRRLAQLMGAMVNNPIFPPETTRDDDDGLTESGWGSESFQIERVSPAFSVGSKFANFSGLDIWPDPRFGLGTNPKAASWTGAWEVKFLRYALPRDCARVERVVVTHQDGAVNRVPLGAWDPAREAIGLDLDPADTGVPDRWLADVVGIGGSPAASMSLAGNLGYPHQITHGGARMTTPEAPTTITAVLSGAAGGDWTAAAVGKRVQYVYTWQFAGMESGPSPVGEATIATAVDKVRLTLEALNDDIGRNRLIYRRVGEGPWRRIGIVSTSTLTAFDDLGTDEAEPAYTNNLDAGSLDQTLRETSNQQWLRLYPRPTVITDLEVRYLAIPRRLVADVDVPEIPEHLHALLVHYVVAGIAAKHGAPEKTVEFHRLQYTDLLGVAMRRYLHTDTGPRVRRSEWDGRRGGLNWDGTITYTEY